MFLAPESNPAADTLRFSCSAARCSCRKMTRKYVADMLGGPQRAVAKMNAKARQVGALNAPLRPPASTDLASQDLPHHLPLRSFFELHSPDRCSSASWSAIRSVP